MHYKCGSKEYDLETELWYSALSNQELISQLNMTAQDSPVND